MMVSKPKPSGGNTTNRSVSPDVDVSDDREKDLERRLALLGVDEDDVAVVEEGREEENTPSPPPLHEEPVVEDLLSMEPAVVITDTPAPLLSPTIVIEEEVVEAAPVVVEPETPAPAPVMKVPVMKPRPIMLETKAEKSPPTAAPVAVMGKKNALLARIMAVQEKAKQAQLKKASATTEVAPPTSVTSYKEQMMEALNDGTTKEQTKAYANPTLPIETAPQFPSVTLTKPTTEQAPPPTVADYRDKMMEALNEGPTTKKSTFVPPPPPPPSFDILEQRQETKPLPPPAAPPSFDTIQYSNMMDEAVLPSAPPVEPPTAPLLDHLSTITSIVPPPAFDTLQQLQPPTTTTEETDDMCDFDLEGNPLTPAQKQKMMEEQRAILAQIQKSTSQDSASQAAARAVAFDQRSNTAAAAAVSDSSNNRRVNSRPLVTSAGGPIVAEVASCTDGVEYTVNQQSVDIGGGQKVELHGQEKTRTAIKDGTAVLIKCLNCDSWMQVTETATLMFCPICSVVSPVVKQDIVPCEEEVKQMDADRRLAEQLQKEENQMETGADRTTRGEYPAARRGGGAVATGSASAEGGSWLDGLLSSNIWSVTEEPSSAEIRITRPPGSRQAGGGLIDANIGTRAGEGDAHDLQLEQENLITNGGRENGRSARAGRVAESKPMFSCVADSIYSTANAVSGAMSSYTNGDENEEVHGVDSSSFLSVTNARRDGDGAGSYRAVPDT